MIVFNDKHKHVKHKGSISTCQMLCLSDVGTVLKVIALNVNSLETEEITLEELQVFKVSFKLKKQTSPQSD